MQFREYLFNENKEFLGVKITSVLDALEDINNDAQNLGNKQLISMVEQIVNQIRKVLHDDWPDTATKQLETLQKVGVALSSGIKSNSDLHDIIKASISEIKNSMEDVKTPINKLGSPE